VETGGTAFSPALSAGESVFRRRKRGAGDIPENRKWQSRKLKITIGKIKIVVIFFSESHDKITLPAGADCN
jgi:hypothetical protein